MEQSQFEDLRDLYASSRAARIVLDYFASRERNSSQTTVDRLMQVRETQGASRVEVVHVLKHLETLELGTFRAGRRGRPSRFEWKEDLLQVGAAAREHETPSTKKPELLPQRPNEEMSLGKPLNSVTKTHTYWLRDDVRVDVELPKDLTVQEASRFAGFIKTLPLEPCE